MINKYLTKEERSHLETVLKSFVETDQRNSLMLLVLMHSGVRPSELLNLTWKDLDLKSGEIMVRSLKGGNNRITMVPKYVCKLLDQYRVARSLETDTTRIFGISYQRLTEIWAMYRPHPDKTLRCLRHTFAQRAYNSSKDIRFVQRALGHKHISNTMIYLDYTYSAEEFRKLLGMK